MSGVEKALSSKGKEVADTYCYTEYLEIYGGFIAEDGKPLTSLYKPSICQSDAEVLIASNIRNQIQEKLANIEEQKRKDQGELERQQAEEDKAAEEAIEKRRVAETLVSASDAQLIGHRAATFYRASFYEQMVSDEKRCWSNASTREGVAKCGIYAISGIMISRLNMIYYTPDNVRTRMTQEISAKLAINTQAATDFIDTYIYPQADNAVKGFYL